MYHSIHSAKLRPMCPVAAPPPGAAFIRKKQSNRDDAHADTTPPALGQTTAALEAPAGRLWAHYRGPGRPGGLRHLVAPQAPSPQPAPGGALPTVTTQPAPTSTLTSTTTIQESNTVPSPSSSSPDTKPSAASRPIATTGRGTTADAPLQSNTTASTAHTNPGATTQ